MKTNKLIPSKEIGNKIADYIKDKINVQNAATHYQISSVYCIPGLLEETSDYIHRCFTMVAKTQSFLQLDFNRVNKILSSSELYVTSEVEVFHAADFWVSCKSLDRTKFAKDIFLKIRFSLLSNHVLQNILQNRRVLRNSSSFYKSEECLVLINNLLENKKEFFKNKASSYYTNRYCNSNKFNILFCGGIDKQSREKDKHIYITEGENLQKFKAFAEMTDKKFHDAVCVNGDLYFVSNRVDDKRQIVLSLEKYSSVTNTWNVLVNLDENRSGYRVCSFVDNIFVVGGHFDDDDSIITNSCIQFNVKSKKFKEITVMNALRDNAACAVFEGKVAVAGGCTKTDFGFEVSNTVEVYDHVADAWSYMPNMIRSRMSHNLITVSDKLFAIGGYTDTSEVYSSFSKKFIALKQQPSSLNFVLNGYEAVSVGRRIFLFGGNSTIVVTYDVDKKEWSEEFCEVTKSIKDYAINKIPQF